MSTFVEKIILCAIHIIVITCLASSAVEPLFADDIAPDVYTAWRARTERIKSLDLRLHTHAKREAAHDPELPSTRSAKLSLARFTFSDQMFQWLIEGPAWRSGRFVDERRIWSFNGDDFQSFSWVIGNDLRPHDVARTSGPVQDAARIREAVIIQLTYPGYAPIWAHCRALDQEFGFFNPSIWKLNGAPVQSQLRDKECYILEFTCESPPGERKCWVCPSMDYCILRLEMVRRLQLDIEYGKNHTTDEFMPEKWHYVQLEKDLKTIERTDEFVVDRIELNPRLTKEHFTISIPEETDVDDAAGRK